MECKPTQEKDLKKARERRRTQEKDADQAIKQLKEELMVQKMHHAAVKTLLMEMKVNERDVVWVYHLSPTSSTHIPHT